MESTTLFEPMERRRRAVIALFVAATFGMAAILSLPVVRLVPFPFRLPSAAEVLGPPATLDVPVPTDPAPGFHPGTLGRLRGHPVVTIEDGGRRDGSNDRPGDPRDEGGADIALVEEPVAGPPIHKEKVPVPPADGEHVSEEKAPATEESELAQKDALDE
jgi:hypothetical protein